MGGARGHPPHRLLGHPGGVRRPDGVARSTVQQVNDTARRRLAQALVEGRRLQHSGGDYVLCPRGVVSVLADRAPAGLRYGTLAAACLYLGEN